MHSLIIQFFPVNPSVFSTHILHFMSVQGDFYYEKRIKIIQELSGLCSWFFKLIY